MKITQPTPSNRSMPTKGEGTKVTMTFPRGSTTSQPKKAWDASPPSASLGISGKTPTTSVA